jgi:hypothetical protein
LSGWAYRKKITIAGSAGAGTNYQVLLKVGESSGTTGADFNLNGLSAKFPSSKNDGGDLRFTASDGVTLQDFWVESVSGTSPNRVAYVWVEVSEDLGTNRDIYVYFGNPNATNVSNGNNTFLLFDDFDGTSLDTNKWQVVVQDDTTSYSLSNSILTISSSRSSYLDWGWRCIRIQSINTNFPSPIALRTLTRFYAPSASESYGGIHGLFGYGNTTSSRTINVDGGGLFYQNANYRTGAFAGSNSHTTNYTENSYSFGNWYLTETKITTSVVNAYLNDSLKGSLNYSISSPRNVSMGLAIGNLSAGYNPSSQKIDFDWVIVRKYVSPEPAFSSSGSVEKRD